MTNKLICVYFVQPASTNPFQIHIEYEGEETFQNRLVNVASENKLLIGYKTEDDSLISNLFALFGSKKRFVSVVELYRAKTGYPAEKRLPHEVELSLLLNGDAYFSFAGEDDMNYFGDLIQKKLNKVIDKESKIYQELLNHRLSIKS